MNRMNEIANMFGVQLDEEFNVIGNDYTERNPLKFTEKGLIDTGGFLHSSVLKRLLIGELQIEKLPFKPKYDDRYYWIDHEEEINQSGWFHESFDFYCFNAGNCFRTKEEITQEDIDRILKEMKGKYGEVEE